VRHPYFSSGEEKSVRAKPEPVEEGESPGNDHLTRFASLTDLSPRGGEVEVGAPSILLLPGRRSR